MFGLAAAPEIVTAVPSVMTLLPPYNFGGVGELEPTQALVRRYPRVADPACSALTVKDAALRSCQASLSPATRFKAMFTICIGGVFPITGTAGHSSFMKTLSRSSNPVNGSGLRSPLALDAPRNARMRRARYMAWSEKRLVSISLLMYRPNPPRIAPMRMAIIAGDTAPGTGSSWCGPAGQKCAGLK